MSVTKKFLADPDNYSDETKRGLASTDPEIRKIIGGIIMRNRIVCNDGFSMSVQYSTGHYCNGRERFLGGDMDSRDDPIPEPRSVEVGFPTRRDILLKPYAEEWGERGRNATGTVYGWVPVEVVDAVIAKHGGIKRGG